MKVLWFPSDFGGCGHYRCAFPANELAKNGHICLLAHTPFIDKKSGEIKALSTDGQIIGDFDVVVFQRSMQEELIPIIDRARAHGQAIVNDVDDWFFGIPTSNRAYSVMHPTNAPKNNTNTYRKILARSSAITVSTPYLGKRLESLGRPVYILRNYIDLHRWTVRPPSPDTLDIGWLGHLGFRASDLQVLSGFLGPWMRSHPQARFIHVGSEDVAAERKLSIMLDIPVDRFESREQIGFENLPSGYDFDIGLAPLEDCPFNQSKSWLKVLEMGARGIPSIASDLPEYRSFREVKLAKRPRDWISALDQLADPVARTQLATQARQRATELDITRHWPLWEAAFSQSIVENMSAALKLKVGS